MSGPTTVVKATPEPTPKTATANSKLFKASVNSIAVVE